MISQQEIMTLADNLEAQSEICASLRQRIAGIRATRDALREELATAELTVQIEALESNGSLGRNADERKLRTEQLLRSDPRVAQLRRQLQDIEADLQQAEAELSAALDKFSAMRNVARLYSAFLAYAAS